MAAIVAISLLSLAISLFQTRDLPLIDRDEGRYSEAARELYVSGDWLVPRLYGVPYLEKPPMFYWLTAAAYAAVGQDELGARLTSGVTGALGVLLTGLFARRYCGGRAGIFAAAILATSGLYFVLARVVVTDMLFSVLIAMALIAFFEAEIARRSFLPFWLFAAAATLTKGPVAAVLCGLTVIGHLALNRRLGRIVSFHFLAGLFPYLCIVLTWLALLQTRYPDFLEFYVYKEHLLRVAGDEHREAFWWYIPWLLVGFLPWTPIWLTTLRGLPQRLRDPSIRGTALRYSVVWMVAVLGFFSVPRGKLVPYILPLFPALAIQLGDALDRWLAGEEEPRGLRYAFLLLGVALLVIAVALPIGERLSPVRVPVGRVAWGVVIGLASAILVFARYRRKSAQPVLAIAGIMAVLQGMAALIAAPIIRPLTAMPVVEILRERMTPEDGFAAYGGYFPNVPFYMRRIPYFVFGNRELDFGIRLEGRGPAVVNDLRELHARLGHRRIFFVLRTRERDLKALFALPGTATLLHRGRSSSLVEYQP